MFLTKKVGDFNKKESESLDFTGLKIPRDYENRAEVLKLAGKGKTLEDSFNALEEILEKLEDEEVSLEDSFKLYQEGMKLVKKCNQSIDKVEKELVVISEEQ